MCIRAHAQACMDIRKRTRHAHYALGFLAAPIAQLLRIGSQMLEV